MWDHRIGNSNTTFLQRQQEEVTVDLGLEESLSFGVFFLIGNLLQSVNSSLHYLC